MITPTLSIPSPEPPQNFNENQDLVKKVKNMLDRMSKHVTDKLRTIYSESYNILSTIIGSILVSTPASFSTSISSSSIELNASKLPAEF